MGFKPHFCGYLRYWAKKIPSSGKPKKDALVFLHGVSPGLLPYYTFLSSLIADEDRDVFLIELPWISMRAYTDFPPVKEYVRCIDIMLNYHNVESACFIGHSYGTIVCAWVLKHCPRLIKSLVLLDPVSLMLIDSSLAANFLHLRSMHSRRQKLKIFKLILLLSFYYISAREIGIAESLSRYLRWQESNIWFDELPSNTTVLLSSKDAIVPVKKVRNFIMNYNTQQHRDHPPKHLLWQDGMPHGGFLLSRPDQSQIIDCIRSRH
jgi:pimeloyl-ACP methyl ester carboxylesterase